MAKKINQMSELTKKAIIRKTAQGLPDRPSASGMRTEDIKKAFYIAMIDEKDSVFSELARIIDEVNDSFNEVNDSFNEVNSHLIDKENPHGVTKEQIGLSNVDNTSDMDKPISNAQKKAFEDTVKQKQLEDYVTNKSLEDKKYATESFVLQNTGTGKIESISVNGVVQEIDENKNVNISVVVNTEGLATEEFVDDKIDELNQTINSLDKAVSKKASQTDLEGVDTRLSDLNDTVATIEDNWSDVSVRVDEHTQKIDTLTNTKASQTDLDSTNTRIDNLKASDINALPDTTKYGASLDLSINNETYVVTAQLKDQDGNNLGTAKTIDLPLESVVVNGYYDKTTKEVVLTLKDGSNIRFSVSDLVSGLVGKVEFETLEVRIVSLEKRVENVESKNTEQDTTINQLAINKVDKVEGKELSSNDFTTILKNKLDGIEASANVNKLENVYIDEKKQTVTDKSINLPISPYYKATCNSSEMEINKVVEIKDFVLKTGSKLEITFVNKSRTDYTLYLKVNNYSAKNINYYTNNNIKPIESTYGVNSGMWDAGDTVQFIYNGSSWIETYNVTQGVQISQAYTQFIYQHELSTGSGFSFERPIIFSHLGTTESGYSRLLKDMNFTYNSGQNTLKVGNISDGTNKLAVSNIATKEDVADVKKGIVTSVNGNSGDVNIDNKTIGAEPSFEKNTAFNKNFETDASNIKINGTQSTGSLSTVARADHIHPTDTSRQETLVSGTNIKTINGQSVLGSGNIVISEGKSAVESVNGKVGTVVLDASDIKNSVTTNTEQSITANKTFNQVTMYKGTCETPVSDRYKVVQIENFVLVEGTEIEVQFTSPSASVNSAISNTIYLNVSNTGNKTIVILDGSLVGDGNTSLAKGYWYSGDIVRFKYSGTSWVYTYNVTKGRICGKFAGTTVDVYTKDGFSNKQEGTIPFTYGKVTSNPQNSTLCSDTNFTYNPETNTFKTPIIEASNNIKIAGKNVPTFKEVGEETTITVNRLLDLIYPINSIRLSDNGNEQSFMGGTWIITGQGRTIIGAGSLGDNQYTVGDLIPAGLPNIKGTLTGSASQVVAPTSSESGALSTTAKTVNQYISLGGSSANRSGSIVNFDASKSNSIYGKSNTVHMNSFVTYIYKRIG